MERLKAQQGPYIAPVSTAKVRLRLNLIRPIEAATLCLEGKGIGRFLNALDLQTLPKPRREAHGCSSAYPKTYKRFSTL